MFVTNITFCVRDARGRHALWGAGLDYVIARHYPFGVSYSAQAYPFG